MTVTAIELFSCAGGMAEGFRRAGINFALAFDASADACDSYEANLGHRPVQMDVHDLVRMTRMGWRPPPLDLLVADPPCTPWSRAGKRRGLEDDRDCLEVTIELIITLRPRTYLIGNVPGLDDGCHLPLVRELLAPLRRDGYCIADFVQLDAADYGVPQHRRRPFWFGHLDGPCLRWPRPTHGDPARLGTLQIFPGEALQPWVTCVEAVSVLPQEERGRPIRMKRRQRDGVLARDRHPISEPDKPARTVTTQHNRPGHFLAWPWDRPATTVCTRPEIGPPGRRGSLWSQSTHPNAVHLSERAAVVIQGFPAEWTICGRTKESRWKQIGQAMPPPLAAAVARSLAGWFQETQR